MTGRPAVHCSIDGCANPVAARGMCTMHYKRVRKHGNPHHITRKTPPMQRRHGHSWVGGKATPEYNAWSSMKSRCNSPTAPQYKNYGARGITVCARWANSFEAFLDDMGEKPDLGYSLERIDNNGNYEPSNCKWATPHEQSRNRRTTNYVDVDGERVCLTAASQRTGIPRSTLRRRLATGWPLERALQP